MKPGQHNAPHSPKFQAWATDKRNRPIAIIAGRNPPRVVKISYRPCGRKRHHGAIKGGLQ